MDFHGLPVQDIRGVLPRSSDPMHGPLIERPLSHLRGIAVHWDAVHRPHSYDSLARYIEEANYHINKDWGDGWHGDGLMYHFKIDNTGAIYYTRDISDMLWAVTEENPYYINICIDCGQDQQPTREQAEALQHLLDELCFNHPEFPASQADVKGHSEVPSNATQCAGNCMSAVFTYRSERNTHPELYMYDYPPVVQPDTLPIQSSPSPVAPNNTVTTNEPVVFTPEPTTADVLQNLPDYEVSFITDQIEKQVIFDDVYAVDATSNGGPVHVPKGALVKFLGYFVTNKKFYRIAQSNTHPEMNGHWYGIAAENIGIDPQIEEPPVVKRISWKDLLATAFSPILRIIGYFYKHKES